MRITIPLLWSVLLSALQCSIAAGGELQGTVKVSGGKVEIQLQTAEGRPAAGVNLRLLYGRQQTVASAPTDSHGRWVHHVEQTGFYEAIVEDGAQVLRLPFMVLTEPAGATVPWLILVPCALCAGGALFTLILALRIAPEGGTPSRPSRGFLVAMAVLLSVGAVLMAWSARHEWTKSLPSVPRGPDLAKDAREFLRKQDVKPLSGPLEQLLVIAAKEHVQTGKHPLLGKTAPDFELLDHRKQAWRLSKLLDDGPVVLVFYYGYHCNHCVGQLFALHDDVKKLRELGAQVITVSADPPELTQDRFKQYGEFAFPVLSDPGYKIAQLYGVYQPAQGKEPEDLKHGTFVIGRDGKIHWTHHGGTPFTDNKTLLYELARLEGRLTSR